MFQLELNDEEREMLADVLRSFLSELKTELSHTDRRAYRERLKDQEHRIRDIQRRLESRQPPSSQSV